MTILLKIKENYHLLIPSICILSWAFYYLIKESFIMNPIDFRIVYRAAKLLYTEPEKLYDDKYRFYYFPSFAIFLALTFSIFPFYISQYLFYSVLIILSLLYIREFDLILKYMNLNKKSLRLIFLIIISSGEVVFYQFYMTQFKFFVAVILFFILRRELEFRREEKEKNMKYYIVNYALFAFAIGIFPFLILFLIIYVFHDKRLSTLFKKDNLKMYGIILLIFAVENLLIFIYPSFIFEIINSYTRHIRIERQSGFPLFYIREWVTFKSDDYFLSITISSIVIAIISLIITFNSKLKLEEKFIYFSLAIIFLSTFGERSFLIILPLILLLFIPYLNQDISGSNFIKENKIVLIGLLSIYGFELMVPDFIIYKYFPLMQEFPLIIIMYLRWIILLSILGASLLLLHLEGEKFSNAPTNSLKIENDDLN